MINCACGETIRGETEEEVLDNAEEHVRTAHADRPTSSRARPWRG
jgi:predicted small metal-binding protein